MKRTPRLVTVVVPARNAARTLPEQLAALGSQDYEGDWEVVVVDNRSRDGTDRVAREWARGSGRGRVVAATGACSPARARNVGARAARGDLVAFTDADDVVSPGWLSAIVAAAADADVVAGRNEVAALNDEVTCSWHGDPPALGVEPHHDFLPIAAGSNSAVWADVFDRLGGFDETSRCGEDVCLSWRAQLGEMTVVAADDALVHQRHRPDLPALARQYFAYGRGDAWLYSRYRDRGMPAGKTLREWLEIWRWQIAVLPRAARCPRRRGRWVRMAALACGRLYGSARSGALYL